MKKTIFLLVILTILTILPHIAAPYATIENHWGDRSVSNEAIFALVGLLGVILGGIITLVSNYVLEARRERAINEKESCNKVLEVKRASRLIDEELSVGEAAARICIQQRHWWSQDVELTSSDWQKYRGIIAPELSDLDWGAVTNAVRAVDNLKVVRENAPGRPLTGPISDMTATLIEPVLQDIMAGRGALRTLVLGGPTTPK